MSSTFTAMTEAEPVYAPLQVCAYRELQIRQRNNDSNRAVMLAYAVGADLDHLGALLGVARLELDPGDSLRSIPPTFESDVEFRRRIQLAPEGFSVAGPEGAYMFHALSADPDVLDASATSPSPARSWSRCCPAPRPARHRRRRRQPSTPCCAATTCGP